MPSRSYRIGYLNPFHEKAENQALMSLAQAAQRGGHAMIDVATSDEVLAAELDFVISIATAQPKLTTVPTFAAIHEPKVRLCGDETLFRNLLSYDGYLTISRSLEEFLGSLNSGFQRNDEVGFYYNTPQISDAAADLAAIVAKNALELCYFGTNWDRRARPLLRALALKPYMRIHGPEEAWAYLSRTPSYKGSVPFDGVSVQATYARHGVGLVVLSREHRLDDVISNRIFEIASVGAVAVCPDVPWIKANFGDSVAYYSSDRSVNVNIAEIEGVLGAIKADPQAAVLQAARARAIFEERFCAERMIDSAIGYFEGWSAKPRPLGPAEPVDVVLRLGDGAGDRRRATVASLQGQTSGRIRLIMVGAGAAEAIGGMVAGAVVEAVAVEVAPGDGASLTAGLAAVVHPLFALIEEGDTWTPARLEESAAALAQATGDAVVLSRVIDEAPAAGEHAERRRLRPWPVEGVPLIESLGHLGFEGLLAPSALLLRLNMPALPPGKAGDAVFLGMLLEHAMPVFTHRPTTIAQRPKAFDDASPTFSAADEVEARLRLGPAAPLAESRLPCPLTAYWQALWEAVQNELVVKEQAEAGEEEANAIEGGQPVSSIHERGDLTTTQLPLTYERLWSQAGTAIAEGEFGSSINIDLFEPHAYCASLDLKNLLLEGPQWIVAEFADIAVPFRIGVVNRVTEEMIELETVPALKDHLEVWLRIENPVPASFVIMAMDQISSAPLRLVGLWLAQTAGSATIQ